MTERRYREAEVRRILEGATRLPEQPSAMAPDGLTLQEIQSIGTMVRAPQIEPGGNADAE